MTHEDLLAKLDARQALIVHFSHHAAMRGELVFPTDLQQVLAETECWPLSCSVLTPGHRMEVVGSVGLVLEPRHAQNVLRVHYGDAGAYDDNGENQSFGEPLSAASFDSSIDHVVPGTYNEWRVRGAKPIGLFVLDPANIEVRKMVPFEGPYGLEQTIASGRISLDEVRATFPDQPIWTMTPEGPRQL